MKQVKYPGLLVAAAAALMTWASGASADSATAPTGTTYTGNLIASSEGHVVFHNPIAKIECASGLVGKVEGHGAGKPVSGNLSSLTLTNCTNDWHVTVVTAGSLSIETSSAGYNGIVRSSGVTFEATRFGITCRYTTNNTPIGTLTGGNPATIDLGGVVLFESGSFLCSTDNIAWTGAYKVTGPIPLYIDNN